jgi:carbonic anhydrase
MCEPAALELGCVVNDIRHIIVCGHSDCKAMNLLHALRDEEFASQVRYVHFQLFIQFFSRNFFTCYFIY